MYPYIVCYCGRSIGDLYDLFKELRAAKFADSFGEFDIDPSMIPITEELQVDLDDIFKSLHIHVPCCRTRLMSQIEFKELY